MKIGILGAGEYGKALGFLLRKSGNATYFYDPIVFPDRALRDVIEFADALVIAVPSSKAVQLLKNFPEAGFLKPTLVATKGIFSLKVYEKFEEIELISGPGFSDEILKNKRIKLTVAAPKALERRTLAEKLFKSDRVLFDKTEDVRGVMMLGALKNIYAIESGRRGLSLATDDFNDFISAALMETQKVLLYNGGFMESIRLNAGVGDYVLTCGSEKSRNYQFGKRLREFENEQNRSKRVLIGIWRASKDERLRKMIRPRGMTIEGLTAARRIERGELFIPREIEILPDILRRMKHDIK